MSICLGVDTGGTYTDAVLIRDETELLASAKALTTRHDLAIGVGGAVRAVLEASGVLPEQIGMAALSTTLATNAVTMRERLTNQLTSTKSGIITHHGAVSKA